MLANLCVSQHRFAPDLEQVEQCQTDRWVCLCLELSWSLNRRPLERIDDLQGYLDHQNIEGESSRKLKKDLGAGYLHRGQCIVDPQLRRTVAE